MSKTFYTDYVRRCMRFYSRHPQPGENLVNRNNWRACEVALGCFKKREQELLKEAYRHKGKLEEAVNEIACGEQKEEDFLWHLIRSLEIKIAKIRGLI